MCMSAVNKSEKREVRTDDTHPELVGNLAALILRLVVAAKNDELMFRRLLRELSAAQDSSASPDEWVAQLKLLRDRWQHAVGEATSPLPPALQSALDDDEPLTPEEAAMLDERRASARTGSTISHDELGKLLTRRAGKPGGSATRWVSCWTWPAPIAGRRTASTERSRRLLGVSRGTCGS